ncbi:MAG: LysE family translocator [Pseudomonadota bacterium]
MSEPQIIFFLVTSVLVILIPGQDMVLVMSRGMTQGAKAGITTAAGVSVGLLGHTLLAALGLGALLLSSELLFTVLKFMGAAYLAYLGIRLLLTKSTQLKLESTDQRPLRRLFIEGALSNISNPKITIFYFAFLPQFISTDINNPEAYLFVLGVSFAVLTFLMKAPIGLFAGLASTWIRTRPAVINAINKISGTLLIGLGLKLALEQR